MNPQIQAGRAARSREPFEPSRSAPGMSFGRNIHREKIPDFKSVESAIHRAQTNLLNLQQPEGFWLGELEANSTLCSDYIAFMHWSMAPSWSPISLYSVSAWTRAMLV